LWDDTYLAGAKVVVDEEIGGDAVMAGASLIVTARVAGDLNAAGMSIVVNGEVGDDLRAIGADVNVGRDVGSDLLAFGGSVSLSPKVSVSGDAAVAAGNVHSSSTIEGSARVAGGRVVFDGIIRGDATLVAVERLEVNGIVEGAATVAAPEIILGPEALFGGDVDYWRESGDMDFGRTLRSGVAVYNPELQEMTGGIFRNRFSRHGPEGLLLLWMIVTSLAGGLCLVVFIFAGRGYFQMAAVELQQAFWKSVASGALYLILTPVAALLLCLSIIGIPIGLLFASAYALSLLFATVTTAFVLVLWIEKKADAIWSRPRLFLGGFSLFLVLKFVLMVPFIGWFAAFFAFSSAFGAMLSCDVKLFRQLFA
jgi:cytoskeletal protein CcmA (bactofilin family)